MSKFESIDLAPRKDKEAIYLCTWNGGEIVQIHTEKTLREDYKGSNLFTAEADETYFSCMGNGYDDLILEDYLKHSKKDDDFLNIEYHKDNMEIERIV